jgi:23S rRNA (uracil1939-C5)-methyltransferase
MGKKKEFTIKSIRLEKLVHGGQCLAEMQGFNNSTEQAIDSKAKPPPSGKKVFAWGGLPGELVSIKISKQKKTYMEGLVVDIHEPSKDRIKPEEPETYLSTSPWQIMTYELENKSKQEILEETFIREGIEEISFKPFIADDKQYGYRNKMELGFWGNDEGLHLANYVRGTHGKAIVQGSELAPECINVAARAVRDELNRLDIWGGKLKTIVLRASVANDVVAALFIKEEIDLSEFKLPDSLKGLDIYYSNPKSPASIASKKLYSFGDITLNDTIHGNNITYDVLSFFQVNIPIFEKALDIITSQLKGVEIVDLYSGVGTIGIAVGAKTLIESDKNNVAMAQKNIGGKKIKVIKTSSEAALEYINSTSTIIVDPPRAGLHKDVVIQLLDQKPLQIVYLSCNPSTQARDIKLLTESYKITHAQGFNFFPRTPHIESVIVLTLT